MTGHTVERLAKAFARRLDVLRDTIAVPMRRIPNGYSSIKSIDPGDIIVAGYPKSGNTWFQILVAGAIYGVSPICAPDTLVNELVPDVHVKKLYRRYQTPMFFKSHYLPRPEYRRVIYLLRDGRDAIVSYWHYLTKLGRRLSLADMVNHQRRVWPCDWHVHVNQWRANPYSAEMITVKYEDLLLDPVSQLERLCDFAHVRRDLEFLTDIADKAAFDKMKRREEILGWDPERRWPKNKPFFLRRGEVGSHTDELPPDILALFLRDAGSTLRASGYLCECATCRAASAI